MPVLYIMGNYRHINYHYYRSVSHRVHYGHYDNFYEGFDMKIIVIVACGVVVDVLNPTEHEVVVRDYDTDGRDEEYIKTDEYGDKFYESIWSN